MTNLDSDTVRRALEITGKVEWNAPWETMDSWGQCCVDDIEHPPEFVATAIIEKWLRGWLRQRKTKVHLREDGSFSVERFTTLHYEVLCKSGFKSGMNICDPLFFNDYLEALSVAVVKMKKRND